MSAPGLRGLHHVKWLVADVAATRAWYERVLGFEVELEFPDDDGAVSGVAGRVPGLDAMLAFRADPERAAALAGTDLLALSVADRATLEVWGAYLDSLDVPHTPIVPATRGAAMGTTDPDGLQVVLYADKGD
jgi:catechol 2,3-dioxygenase-like lactoylglutathione lyase family enzyme